MTDFAQTIADWETFYLLAGTAAATLMGLLFVAVSIHLEIFHRDVYRDLQNFATLTFNCFFYVLLMSILFLVPGIPPLGLGIPILLLGLLGLGNALLQQRRARRIQLARKGANTASRFNVPIASMVGMAAVGLTVMLQITEGLYLLVAVIIAFLASAGVNAFTLLIHRDEQEIAKSPERE